VSALPPVASLWIGEALSWLERLCLTSFVAQGHPVTLYTYGPVEGVPTGITLADGREILENDDVIVHRRRRSVAPFSDLFRFTLLFKRPGVTWVDTDVYCLRPLDGTEPFLFGYEIYHSPERSQVNSAVLRLPPGSGTLSGMLEFMQDLYPVPEWLPKRALDPILARRAAGDPMHVSEMVWGLWGPLGLTEYLRKTGEIAHARPPEVFYPVHFADKELFFQRPMKTLGKLTEATRTIHLWSPVKKIAAKEFGGRPPEGSFLGRLLAEHGIDSPAG